MSMQNKTIVILALLVLATLLLRTAALSQPAAAAPDQSRPLEHLSGRVAKSSQYSCHLARPTRTPAAANKHVLQRPSGRGSSKPVSALGKSTDFDFAPKTKLPQSESLFASQKADPGLFKAETSTTELQQNVHQTKRLAAVELSLEEQVDGRVIHWDDWYRRFVENLYLRFHRANNGDYPGECRVLITVTNKGDLNILGGDDFHKQSGDFQETLNRAARLLTHSATLEFPPGSLRDLVRFTMSVRSSQEKGDAGYGWTSGDTEKIPAAAAHY